MAVGEATFGPEWMWGCENYWECDSRGGEAFRPDGPNGTCSTHGLVMDTLIPEEDR